MASFFGRRVGWHSMLVLLFGMFGILLAGCAGQESVQSLQKHAIVSAQQRRFSEGEALYIRDCAGCHGWEGRGDGPMARILGVRPPGLRGPQINGRYTEAELTARILFGNALLIPPDPAKIASTEAEIAALVAHLKRLPQIDWEYVDKGRESYDALCAYCHGIYGRGDGVFAATQATLPRDLGAPAFQEKTSDPELLRIISEGQGNMPGAKDVLSEEDIRSVVAYLRVLSPGFESYERFCARCHGSDGYPPSDSSDGIFGVPPFSREELIGAVFDEDYFRTHPESAVRLWAGHMYRKDHSSMPYFGSGLDGVAVRKILVYLRQLPP